MLLLPYTICTLPTVLEYNYLILCCTTLLGHTAQYPYIGDIQIYGLGNPDASATADAAVMLM